GGLIVCSVFSAARLRCRQGAIGRSVPITRTLNSEPRSAHGLAHHAEASPPATASPARRQPAWVVGATVFVAAGQEAGRVTARAHYPEPRRLARPRAAESDLCAVRRFHRTEVPAPWLGGREAHELPGRRVQSADLGAAAREIRPVVAVEMVDVRPPCLEFPR